MKYKSLAILLGLILAIFGLWRAIYRSDLAMLSPLTKIVVEKEKPYLKYSFDKLSERVGNSSSIDVADSIFYYYSEGRRISGAITYPEGVKNDAKYPVVVMARGYVEKEGYESGMGTKRAAEYYSENGFITLAPDFPGYGKSDPADENVLGARLAKPAEIMDLIASLKYLPHADLDTIYLWGHSNGGQIMLSVAEILGRKEQMNRNTEYRIKGVTLWAPVSKPFPYNILYYTDEATDSGKWLRKEVSEFEKDYDVFSYSVDRYLDWINIPILIHQGVNDEAVPKNWSDDLVENLKEIEKVVDYRVYPGADHNMRPAWDLVVLRDVEWFKSLK